MNHAFYPIVRAFTSIALALGLIILPVSGQSADAPKEAVVGFEDASGKTLFLHDFKGRPVLINLWASWCAPCVKEMPSLVKLQQEAAAKGLAVLALSEDDTPKDATDFFQKNKISTLPFYFDKGHGVMIAVEARGLPTSLLINREGKVVQRIEGPVDWQAPQVKAMLAQIIGK